MRLRTLGGLYLEESEFRRTKLLSFLAYLSVEGPKDRAFLADLFWSGAANPRNAVAKAVTLLNDAAPGSLQVDGVWLRSTVATDVEELSRHLDRHDPSAASRTYRGAFLDGVRLHPWPVELEEWVQQTREFLARRLQLELLRWAEARATAGDFGEAASLAGRAWRMPGTAGCGMDDLRTLHGLLVGGEDGLALAIERESASFGIELRTTVAEARARYGHGGSIHHVSRSRARPTSFVGRDDELAVLASHGRDATCRWITVTGSGGSGKTRLAFEFARREEAAGRWDAVHVARLDGVAQPEEVLGAIGMALGMLSEEHGTAVEGIAAGVGQREVLLVLDNFEHVRPAARQVADLLEPCPRLTLLVTSREPLRLRDEWVLPLGGLPLPDAHATATADLLASAAVSLFVQRARQANLLFRAEGTEVAAAARICRMLAGSPLGIELAAASTRAMPCARIAAEVERSVDFLEAGHDDHEARHRNVRALFASSWRRLDTPQRRALAALSVFRGGFTGPMASEVAGCALAVLVALVDRALVEVLPDDRYRLHPLVQEYAREMLAGSPGHEREVLMRRAAYYLKLLERSEADLWNERQTETVQLLASEFDDLRAAWPEVVATAEPGRLRRAAQALEFYCVLAHAYDDGIALFREAVRIRDGEDADPFLVALLKADLGWLLLGNGRLDEAEREAVASLGSLQAAGDREALLYPLVTLGACANERGDFEGAKAWFTRLLRAAREVAQPRFLWPALSNLGIVEAALGNYHAAEALLREARGGLRSQGNHAYCMAVAGELACVVAAQERMGEARSVLHEALQEEERHPLPGVRAQLLAHLADLHLTLGDLAAAEHTAREAVEQDGATRPVAVSAGLVLARVAWRRGELARADDRYRDALATAWREGQLPAVLTCLSHLAERSGEGGMAGAIESLDIVLAHPATPFQARRRAAQAVERQGLRAAGCEASAVPPGIVEVECAVHRILRVVPRTIPA